MLEHLFESVKIETIPNVVFIDSAEEGMILEVAKPADPTIILL